MGSFLVCVQLYIHNIFFSFSETTWGYCHITFVEQKLAEMNFVDIWLKIPKNTIIYLLRYLDLDLN